MRQINMMTGLDMEQHSQTPVLPPDIPPANTISSFEPYGNNNNNSMFYRLPQSHHHQRMSTPPNLYLPYAPFHAPGSHGVAVGGTSTEHERDAHFMGYGYKRKSTAAEATPCSFPPEIAPFSFPHYGPQPVDQTSGRNRAGAATMDPPLSHVHNNFIQGSYAAHPFPTPASIWYDQRFNGSSLPWSQPPCEPYMHGNVATGSMDSGNVCFPRYHETSSSRNHTPFLYPTHNHFSHHPSRPPSHLPSTVYPHLASASNAIPVTIHDASYRHVGPVLSTGFRSNPQHPRDEFVPAATLRHHGQPRFRAFPTVEVAVYEEGDFYDAVDHHQDMRLDIEDMSYEELLALSDHIGTVKTGLSEEDVEVLLKKKKLSTRINLEEAPSTDLETDSCAICQENYKNQDKIATLDCRHEYHVECLKNWLVIKNICPVCKSEALVLEKKKEK